MKRIMTQLIFALLILNTTGVNADINWHNDFEQFSYSVNKNGGSFIYPPAQYYRTRQSTETLAYNPFQGQFDPLSSVAYGELVEFGRSDIPGQITLKASAKGPAGGQNPENGLTVQAFAEIVPDSMTIDHGVRIDQQVIAFIVRTFSVDQADQYTVRGTLDGVINFDAFKNSDFHQATYKIIAEVELEELANLSNGEIEITRLPGFPLVLAEDTRSLNVQADLVKQNSRQMDVSYRLKVVLRIESLMTNLAESQGSTSIIAPITGTYQLATEDAPLKLSAIIDQEIVDTDEDGVPDSEDNCPTTANPDQANTDGDELGDACDPCIQDPNNADSDGDGTPDCTDICSQDPAKTEPGLCGCGMTDNDLDGDGFICDDAFPNDPGEWLDTDGDGLGNNADEDDDNDGMPDLWEKQFGLDPLSNDAGKDKDGDGASNLTEYRRGTDPADITSVPQNVMQAPMQLLLLNTGGIVDTDNDGVADAQDNCPDTANLDQSDSDSDGRGDLCDACPDDPDKIEPGICGCGVADTDNNENGIPDCEEPNCDELTSEGCPLAEPENLTSEIIKDSDGNITHVRLSWDAIGCARLYYVRISPQPNITELPLGTPGLVEFNVFSTSWTGNAVDGKPGTYYWAVVAACQQSPTDRGEWSEVKSFSF